MRHTAYTRITQAKGLPPEGKALSYCMYLEAWPGIEPGCKDLQSSA